MASVTDAPVLTVRDVALFERDVRLRMPFRFGVVTMTGAPQLFARVRIALPDGREGTGVAAEMLGAKWFDKNLALTHEQNYEQLRLAVALARDAYLGARRPTTAFGLFAGNYAAQIEEGARRGLNSLVASYGPALLDRAILDALCRIHGISFYEAVRRNAPGIVADDLAPDLGNFNVPAFLSGLQAAQSIYARHTVGLVDAITAADQPDGPQVRDGLPETLEQVVAFYGCRYFKLKVGGDVAADVERLSRIASVLDRIGGPYFASLDGNEQYADADGLLALWDAMERTPALARLMRSILFIEQPIARAHAFDKDIGRLSAKRPVIIDESDGDLDAYVRARAKGYRGVSSKTCKGFYKSLLNAARCAQWNRASGGARYFMSAEDLTTQAGVSVQQDLALVNLLGLTHVERNGHHYVNGLAAVPVAEQSAFLAAHPDLYRWQDGVVRLRIDDGRLALGSLACAGFAVAAVPDWNAMRPMPAPPERVQAAE
ncbi:MAG TPA: enolase C-terminal domain-like protein [Candidatus Cybelea sp.]|nr:enolase C-terminal domain-like protein [Candidatus Cybelea sp.]